MPGPPGPPGLLDGASLKLLPNGLALGDELVIYRPGSSFYYVTASLLNPNAIIFDDQDAVFGGVPLSYGTAAAAE